MSLSALLLSGAALAATLPPGESVDPAAAVQISQDGLNGVAALIPALLPSEIEIPGQESWSSDPFGWCDYGYGFTNGWVTLDLKDAQITPGNGTLDITMEMGVSINDAASQFNLDAEGFCFIDIDCPGYIDEFPVYVNTSMALQIVDGALDATIGEMDVSYGLDGSHMQLDCAIQDVEDVLDWFGLSIYDLIIDLLAGELEGQISSLGEELETTIEESFAALSISEEFEVNGAVLTVDLAPSDVQITPDGLALIMGGRMDADADDCVDAWDPGGSMWTQSSLPPIGGGSGAAVMLSDEIANQALYALWRGGLLCVDLSEIDIGLELDTSILGLMVGDAFDEFFPEAKPITMLIEPKAPPEAVYDGSHDIGVVVEQLGLDVYAELDDRMTRVLGLELGVDAGVDLLFDDTTGELGIDLALSGENITATVAANELAAEANPEIEQSFSGVFETLVLPLLDGILGDSTSFAIPSFEGVGLTGIAVSPGGDGDWLQIEAGLGEVPYESAGCDEEGGCDSGCEGGCASGRVSSKWAVFGTLFGLLLVRRRS